VVVTAGETVLVPEATGVSEPMLLSIEKVVALVVVHESTEEAPTVIEAGAATSVQTGATGGGGTTGKVQVIPVWLVAAGL
jgi:hypothetical protein